MKKIKTSIIGKSILAAVLAISACVPTRETAPRGDDYNIGYSKISKEESTTSVGTWKRDQSMDNPTLSIVDMLSRVPGVQISGNDQFARITIRGISSINSGTEPLFVVDGMAVGFGLNSVSFLNPLEISRISVLKDSAAAIYGLRASNGVIIIETKGPPVEKKENRDRTRQ